MSDTLPPQNIDLTREDALPYFKILVDVARESFLILDSDIRVVLANSVFYENFQVAPSETEGKTLFELGNGQWNIPELRTLLEKILPEKKIVKNYEVTYNFEMIGLRTMLLNARQIDSGKLIVLAIEDISIRKNLENRLAEYTTQLESKVSQRTGELSDKNVLLDRMNRLMVGRELKMVEQKREIAELKNTQK